MTSRESIFVDSGAWVALADRGDAHHQKAASVYPSLLKTYRSLVTSNLVIAEAYVIILNELGHNAAIDFIERINASPRILKICSGEDIEAEAVNTLSGYLLDSTDHNI
jgi:predicted nucleic acid-binding protein